MEAVLRLGGCHLRTVAETEEAVESFPGWSTDSVEVGRPVAAESLATSGDEGMIGLVQGSATEKNCPKRMTMYLAEGNSQH